MPASLICRSPCTCAMVTRLYSYLFACISANHLLFFFFHFGHVEKKSLHYLCCQIHVCYLQSINSSGNFFSLSLLLDFSIFQLLVPRLKSCSLCTHFFTDVFILIFHASRANIRKQLSERQICSKQTSKSVSPVLRSYQWHIVHGNGAWLIHTALVRYFEWTGEGKLVWNWKRHIPARFHSFVLCNWSHTRTLLSASTTTKYIFKKVHWLKLIVPFEKNAVFYSLKRLYEQ